MQGADRGPLAATLLGVLLAAAPTLGEIIVPIGTLTVGALGSYFVYKKELLVSGQASAAKAAGSATEASQAAEEATRTSQAFVRVIVDLQRSNEAAAAKAERAETAAREAQAAEERCKAESVRLQGLIEGILDARKNT